MGYTTEFDGELLFKPELTTKELAVVKKVLDMEQSGNGDYIDLEINDDFSGIRWNGAEKTYNMEGTVEWVINEVRTIVPTFGLTGELLAQGEDHGDRWRLVMVDGIPVRKEYPRIRQRITCPLCEGEFTLEEV